jgi:hypothetical protein
MFPCLPLLRRSGRRSWFDRSYKRYSGSTLGRLIPVRFTWLATSAPTTRAFTAGAASRVTQTAQRRATRSATRSWTGHQNCVASLDEYDWGVC